MEGQEHSQLLEKLAEIKQSFNDRFGTLDKGLSLNTQETAHQGKDISEIKQDVKDIKQETVSRRELTEVISGLDIVGLRNNVKKLEEFRWKLAGMTSLAAATMTFIGQIILKYFN